jgi:cellulose synthase operon protein C
LTWNGQKTVQQDVMHRSSQIRQLSFLCALSAFAIAPTSIACGPDFPTELLTQRTNTMQGLPSGNFEFEANKLVQPAHKYAAEMDVNTSYWFEVTPETPVPEAQKKIETEGYSAAQINDWLRARNASSVEEAMQAAASLPKAHQLYLAGANAFNRRTADDFADAKQNFEAVLALGKEGESRAVWAQHMLARIAAFNDSADIARAEFEKVRQLAKSGAPDPLGLATASLGAQAWLDWQKIDAALDAPTNAAHATRAVALYAEQAASGSTAGSNSLLIAARYLRKNSAVLEIALQDALVRKLMLSYAFSRGFEALGEAGQESYYDGKYIDSRQFGGADGAPINPTLLDTLLNSVPAGQLEGGDRFAAALYRAGRFDAAKRFADANTSALSHWVLAKLALRNGDKSQAAKAYASAIQTMPKDTLWIENGYELGFGDAKCRTQAELGTLQLSSGDIDQAMQLFFDAGPEYITDFSYIAERAATTEALQKLVDQKTKVVQFSKQPEYEGSEQLVLLPTPSASMNAAQVAHHHQVRSILARRLMREGKRAQALNYFDQPELQSHAKAFNDAIASSESSKGVPRAEALFKAASLAREHGIDLLGYQLAPDYAIWGGAFGAVEDDAGEPLVPKPDTIWQSKLESEQFLKTTAVPNKRFHYRFIAANMAEQAAGELPARSQAFAASLCHATRWVIYRDEAQGKRYYQRYVKEGAYVPWGGVFGTTQDCPAPNFASAQAMLDQQTWQMRKRLLKKALPWVVGGFSLLILLGIVLKLRARKHP